jgi:hypothetical protein
MIRTTLASLAPVGDAARLRAGASASTSAHSATALSASVSSVSVWCAVPQSNPNAGMATTTSSYAAFGTKRHSLRPSEVLIT